MLLARQPKLTSGADVVEYVGHHYPIHRFYGPISHKIGFYRFAYRSPENSNRGNITNQPIATRQYAICRTIFIALLAHDAVTFPSEVCQKCANAVWLPASGLADLINARSFFAGKQSNYCRGFGFGFCLCVRHLGISSFTLECPAFPLIRAADRLKMQGGVQLTSTITPAAMLE